jgi:hypothetical protein
MRRTANLAPICIICLAAAALSPAFGQDIKNTAIPLDENALFGGAGDLVTVIDTAAAAAGTIQLVQDTKTYPVFLVEGDVLAGLAGDYTAYGATGADAQTLFGAVSLDGLSLSFLPAKDINFNLTVDGTFMPADVQDLEASAYADIRASEFTRVYAAASYKYNVSSSSTSLVETAEGFSLDEIFVDTAIGRKVFFRLGKQNVSWGVGNWYKPADVLSLAAIDPDDPSAAREGPFAFKVDTPFGKLNHATLYMVPPTNGDIGEFSAAERTDIVAGGFELSFAGFYRSDFSAKPRVMFMFSGALGNFDLYGEGVAAWGSDRVYAREVSAGVYDTYTIENTPVFQATLGAKYSWENSDGFGVDLHAQGYYNGQGYQDSAILRNALARAAIKAADGDDSLYLTRSGAGMYYLAASASAHTQWGEGKKLSKTTLGGTALFNFSDGSARLKPSWSLTIGSGGSVMSLTASALAALGETLSEYAPKGNMLTPAISMTIMNAVVAQVSAPLKFDADYAITKADMNFSLFWDVVNFDKKK